MVWIDDKNCTTLSFYHSVESPAQATERVSDGFDNWAESRLLENRSHFSDA